MAHFLTPIVATAAWQLGFFSRPLPPSEALALRKATLTLLAPDWSAPGNRDEATAAWAAAADIARWQRQHGVRVGAERALRLRLAPADNGPWTRAQRSRVNRTGDFVLWGFTPGQRRPPLPLP